MNEDRAGTEGHPLPASGEARRNEVPEDLEAEKGNGDDAAEVAAADPVNPDGTPYRGGDLGRGPNDEEDMR